MKKVIILLAMCCLVLGGCSSGVSQKDYDAALEETTKLKEENEKLSKKVDDFEKIANIRVKSAEYRARVDEQYNHAKLVIFIGETVAGQKMPEALQGVENTRNSFMKYAETTEKLYSIYTDAPISDENNKQYETTVDTLDNMYSSWKQAYEAVLVLEKHIMGEQ